MSELLKGWENADPLPTEFNADGKSLANPPGNPSDCYDKFPSPIDSSNNGFDFHVYYEPNDEQQVKYARELHERIRREFPELRIYRLYDKPVGEREDLSRWKHPLQGVTVLGPHPTAMFEVNVFNPHQTGAFFSFLAVNRGPCSVLIHPNTGNAFRDHTELATWMGPPLMVNAKVLASLGI